MSLGTEITSSNKYMHETSRRQSCDPTSAIPPLQNPALTNPQCPSVHKSNAQLSKTSYMFHLLDELHPDAQ